MKLVDNINSNNSIMECNICFDELGWNVGVRGFNESDFEEVKDFELLEYTGLKDINDAEIYEGDIVAQFNFEDKFFRTKVVCKNGSFGYVNPLFNEFISYASNIAFEWKNGRSEKIEVIGNIYEDPELLQCVEKYNCY